MKGIGRSVYQNESTWEELRERQVEYVNGLEVSERRLKSDLEYVQTQLKAARKKLDEMSA